MIAITPWILVLAATCQDPKPVTPVPEAQAPVSQTPAPIPPAAGATSTAQPSAQDAGGTKPVVPSDAQSDKSKDSGVTPQQPETDKPGADSGAKKSDADKAAADGAGKDKTNPESSEEPRPDAKGWIGLDGVALIINQDITTQGDIEREYFIKYRDKPVTENTELNRRQSEILNDRVKRVLAMQAGEDLGASEELVKLQIDEWFGNIVKRFGGVVALTKLLEARHQTPLDLRKDRREEIYVRLWEGLVTGEGAGTGKRPIRDRFVRPGELKFHYNRVMQDSGNYAALGGKVEVLTLQQLLLDAKENGGLDKTIEFAQGLRQRILDGDDMSELVQKYGKEKDGMIRDISLPDLKRQFPSMGNFGEKAQVDDVSEPMRLPTKAGTYVQILRLVDRKPAVKPELVSQEVQKRITEDVQKELDELRKRQAYGVLFQASYVWPEQRSKQQ